MSFITGSFTPGICGISGRSSTRASSRSSRPIRSARPTRSLSQRPTATAMTSPASAFRASKYPLRPTPAGVCVPAIQLTRCQSSTAAMRRVSTSRSRLRSRNGWQRATRASRCRSGMGTPPAPMQIMSPRCRPPRRRWSPSASCSRSLASCRTSRPTLCRQCQSRSRPIPDRRRRIDRHHPLR